MYVTSILDWPNSPPFRIAAVITDICANLDPLPIAGAVALGGSPAINVEIVSLFASPILLSTLPIFGDNTNVAVALAARITFIDALFNDPENTPFSLKCRYLGETVLQMPDVSANLSMRPQDPSKLFAAGEQGLPLQLLFGKQDKLVNGEAVVKLVQPHFKNLTLSFMDGGHAVFHDNEKGMVEELTKFVLRVTVRSIFLVVARVLICLTRLKIRETWCEYAIRLPFYIRCF
jgi:hypothetical protein